MNYTISGSTANILIYGGFVNGSRTSDIYEGTISSDLSAHWALHKFPYSKTSNTPLPRAGHSGALLHGKLMIFGGHDEENDRLGDAWIYDTKT